MYVVVVVVVVYLKMCVKKDEEGVEGKRLGGEK